MVMTRSVFACCNYVVIQAVSHWSSFSKQSMESGSFPSEWKKGNVVSIHKKDDTMFK